MSSISKQQQQNRRRLNIQHARNTNAYFDRQDFSRSNNKPFPSISSSSINSEKSNHRDFYQRNLPAAVRQQNYPSPTNLNAMQTFMNSLIFQQQQQQSSSTSTIQLQYQLTNALLATMIQQRWKETALQAQAQQIQAAIPTLLALAYQQQSGQMISSSPPTHSWNVAHPGTKFNNRPLVKFAPVRSPTNRLANSTSTMILPTYQQVQEIERGISLDQAIHFKNAIHITDVDKETSRKS